MIAWRARGARKNGGIATPACALVRNDSSNERAYTNFATWTRLDKKGSTSFRISPSGCASFVL